MASKPVTKRVNGSSGKLMLPPAKITDSASVKIGGVEIIIKFGNIFEAECANWIPVIPNFYGGVLKGELEGRCGKELNIDAKYFSVDTGLPEIPQALLYIYDTMTQRLEEEFEELAKMCPDGSTLVFPTFGINNGMSFHESAFNIFYGMISCLETENSPMRKLSKIVIMTLYNEDQDNGGTRTIKHLFNLVNVYNGIMTNKTCAICASAKVDTIISCGHYILCSRCLIDIDTFGRKCPMCRKDIQYDYPCYITFDSQEYKCCMEHHSEKEHKICIPCGHFNVACGDCGKHIDDTKICPICNEEIFAYIPFFDS